MKRKQGGTRNIPSDVIIYFSILSRGYQIPASLGAEGTASLLVVLIAVLPRPGIPVERSFCFLGAVPNGFRPSVHISEQ